MKAQGLSDEDIAIEVDKIKAQILEDYKEHEANGTLDEAFSDADEDGDGDYSSNIRLH